MEKYMLIFIGGFSLAAIDNGDHTNAPFCRHACGARLRDRMAVRHSRKWVPRAWSVAMACYTHL